MSFREREEQKYSYHNSTPEQSISEKNNTVAEDDQSIAIRNRILNASLTFVEGTGNLGWTRQALVKGAESIGYPSVTHGVFSRGGIELINYFYLKCNQNLMSMIEMQMKSSEVEKDPKDFVRWALQQRLSMNIPYIRSWSQALGIMTLPQNVPTSLANLLTLVDDVCYFTGDRSVDFNWYTRRIGLATIYKTTELYMLQDISADYDNTWQFLERRIEDASKIQDVIAKTDGATQNIQQTFGAVFTTARNILGLNFNKR